MNGAKWHPFHIACISGNINDTKKKLARGGSNLVDLCDANGFTAIHFAVLSGNVDMVQLIASHQPNINTKCSVKGTTALIMAVAKEHIDIVRILLEHGADVSINRDEDGKTAMHVAAAQNCGDMARLLLNYSPDTLQVLDNSGANPISLAIEKESQHFLDAVTSLLPEYEQIIKLKMARKCDKLSDTRILPETILHRSVSISNTPGRRLLEAARNGDCDAISAILAEAPSEINYRGNNGRTALMEAAETGHHLAVALLIRHGADTELRTKKHLTALQLAVREGYVQATRALLEGGAEENVVTRDGKTIEEICVSHGHDALLAWLQGRHVRSRTPTPPVTTSPAAPTSQLVLSDWLKHIGLQRYSTILAANGFETLASLDVIQDQDLETMGFLLGHKRVFLKEFNVLRQNHRQLLQREALPVPTITTATTTTTSTSSGSAKKRSRRRKKNSNSGLSKSTVSSETERSSDSIVSDGIYVAADALMQPHVTTSFTSSISNDDLTYASVASAGVKEICFEEVVQGRIVGEGSFGTVKEGVWRGMRVALKELKIEAYSSPEVANQQLNELKREAATMARVCNHAHIIQFIGIVVTPKPCVVTVFCSNGSVETMLVNRKHVHFDLDCLSRMALEAALGVQHLHLEGVIHRDLAARNLLIDDTYHVRVADFGFARAKEHAASKGYTRSDMGPIRWSAPEAMRRKIYSEASDVFSFGVVLFEIFQREMPWSGVETIDVLFRVCSGEQMSIDETIVPSALAELMRQCWDTTPINRPTICEIINTINIFRESQGYSSYHSSLYDDSSEVSFSMSQESMRIYDTMG